MHQEALAITRVCDNFPAPQENWLPALRANMASWSFLLLLRLCPSVLLSVHSCFIHSTNLHQTPLCARHSARLWKCNGEQNVVPVLRVHKFSSGRNECYINKCNKRHTTTCDQHHEEKTQGTVRECSGDCWPQGQHLEETIWSALYFHPACPHTLVTSWNWAHRPVVRAVTSPSEPQCSAAEKALAHSEGRVRVRGSGLRAGLPDEERRGHVLESLHSC